MTVSLNAYLHVVRILLCESTQGYIAHKYIAIGLLNYLSDILTLTDKDLANKIRSIRILILDDFDTALVLLDSLIGSYDISIPFIEMPRESCYDCCIKHLTTAAVYRLANNEQASVANLIEALNEAPASTDDYIKESIRELIKDPTTIAVNIWGLIEVVDSERTKNGL